MLLFMSILRCPEGINILRLDMCRYSCQTSIVGQFDGRTNPSVRKEFDASEELS